MGPANAVCVLAPLMCALAAAIACYHRLSVIELSSSSKAQQLTTRCESFWSLLCGENGSTIGDTSFVVTAVGTVLVFLLTYQALALLLTLLRCIHQMMCKPLEPSPQPLSLCRFLTYLATAALTILFIEMITWAFPFLLF